MKQKKVRMKPTHRMHFRRRREGRTDYSKRLMLLKSGKLRLVVRKSLNYIRAQIIEYDKTGDKTVASAVSSELRGLGWKFACDNLPAAYLTGMLIGKKAKNKNIEEVVLDAGLYPSTKGSRIYAVVKGVLDSGVHVPHSEEMLPSDERITGKHIADQNEKFKALPAVFEKTKQKILGGKVAAEKTTAEEPTAEKPAAKKKTVGKKRSKK